MNGDERLRRANRRAPGLDALLDLLAGEVLLERLLGQLDDFIVRGKAESDQLVFGETAYLSVPLGRRERLQAKALFQADDAILHFERVGAQLGGGDEGGDGQDDDPFRIMLR